jgi:hypothetical protein
MTLPLDTRALRALPQSTGPGRWLTSASLAQRIDVAPDVARSVLVRLRARELAEHDGEHPQAFARTAKVDWQLEQDERLSEAQP